MNATETPAQRLSRTVRERRQYLGLSVRAAAKLAGVDRATWTALEEGTRVTQDRHYGGIERALEWPAGHMAGVVRGAGVTAGVSRPSPDEVVEMTFEQLGAKAAEIERAEGYEAANRFFEEAAAVRLGEARKASQRG